MFFHAWPSSAGVFICSIVFSRAFAQRCSEHQRKISQNSGAATHCMTFAVRVTHSIAKGCFDLFGVDVDVMVDSTGHPGLLEVNSHPAFWDTPGVLGQVVSAYIYLGAFVLNESPQVIPEVVGECVDIMLELQSPEANARFPAALKAFELLAHLLP